MRSRNALFGLLVVLSSFFQFNALAVGGTEAQFTSTPSGTISSSSFTLKWSAPTAPAPNELIFVKIEIKVNGSVVDTKTVTGATQLLIENASAGAHVYTIRVRRNIYTGDGWEIENNPDDTVAFTVANAIPPVPSLDNLASYSINGDYDVSWSASTGANFYILEETKNSVSTEYTISSGTLKQFRAKTAGRYYYKVKACASLTNCSDYSSSDNTHAVYTPSSSPTITSNASQPSTGNTGTISVEWTEVVGAGGYLIREGNGTWVSDPDFVKTYANRTTGDPYTYQVKACAITTEAATCSTATSKTITLQYESTASISGPTTSRGSYTLSLDSSSLHSYFKIWEDGNPIESGYSSDKITFNKTSDDTYRYFIQSCLSNLDGPDRCSSNSTPFNVQVLLAPTNQPTPTLSDTTVSNGSLTVSWGKATGTVHRYLLRASSNNGSTYGSRDKGTELSHTYSGLADNTYKFYVEACNTLDGVEVCDSSSVASTVYVANKPNKPGAFTAISSPDTDGQYTVSWGSENSGFADKYLLERSSNGGTSWQQIQHSSATSKVEDVGNGTYRYRVKASNTQGSFTSFSATVTSADVVVSPPIPTARPTFTSANSRNITTLSAPVTVTWTEAGDYNHRIKYLDKTDNITSSWYSSTTGRKTFPDNLYIGDYVFTIQACLNTNVSATCGPSRTQNYTLAYGSTMTASLSTNYSRGSYRLTWTPDRPYIYVTENGTTNIPYDNALNQDYVDFSNKADGNYGYQVNGCLTAPDDDVQACTGNSGTKYVNVVNAPHGQSSPSVPISGTSDNGSVALSWGAPTSGRVDRYLVYKRAVGTSSWGTGVDRGTNRSHTFSNLTDGSYEFKVASCNTVNPSDSSTELCVHSSASEPVILALKPQSPGTFTAVDSPNPGGTFTLEWGATSSNYADFYELYQSLDGGPYNDDIHDQSLTNTKEISGLTDGVYRFKVVACNTESTFTSCSEEVFSDLIAVQSPIPTIAPVLNSINPQIADEGGSIGTIHVSWEKVEGFAHRVKYFDVSQGLESDWYEGLTDPVDQTVGTISFTGRSIGEYLVTVESCLDISVDTSCGPSGTQTINLVNQAVISISGDNFTRGEYILTLNAGIEFNHFKVWEDDVELTREDDSSREVTLPGNIDGTYAYQFQACVEESGVQSDCTANSETFTVVVRRLPTAPNNITVPEFSIDGVFIINWSEPELGEVEDYQLFVKLIDEEWPEEPIYKGSLNEYDSAGLADGTYEYRVQACNRLNEIEDCGEFIVSSPVVVGLPTDITVNFNDYVIDSYAGSQDAYGVPSVSADGSSLSLTGNSWKQIALNYRVTANTVLEFDFSSTQEGELHSIGFDNQVDVYSGANAFQLYGVQGCSACTRAYRDYSAGQGTKHYAIPIGQFYTGAFTRLFFGNDEDRPGNTNANGTFSNIRIYEADNLPTLLVFDNDSPNVTIEGSWDSGASVSNGWNLGYLTSSSASESFTRKLTEPSELAESGLYQIYLWWVDGANRSNSVPIEIKDNHSTNYLHVDQSNDGLQGRWNLLGSYDLAPGSQGFVKTVSEGAQFASVDAVRLVRTGAARGPLITIDYPGLTEQTNLTTNDEFDVTVLAAIGRENEIQTIEFNLDEQGWQSIALQAGAFNFNYGTLDSGQHIFAVRINGTQVYTFELTVDEGSGPARNFYFVSPQWLGKTAVFYAVENGTVVTIEGQEYSLDKGQTGTHTVATQGSVLTSNKQISVSSQSADLHNPPTDGFKGKNFAYRNLGGITLHLMSPEADSTANITLKGVTQEVVIPQGDVYSYIVPRGIFDRTFPAAIIQSDENLIVTAGYDGYIVQPLANEFVFINDRYTVVSAAENNTAIDVFDDTGRVRYGTQTAGSFLIAFTRERKANLVKASNPSYVDGTSIYGSLGGLSLDKLKQRHVLATEARYVVVACIDATTDVSLYSQTGEILEQKTCSASPERPNSVTLGEIDGSSPLSAGTEIVASEPVLVNYLRGTSGYDKVFTLQGLELAEVPEVVSITIPGLEEQRPVSYKEKFVASFTPTEDFVGNVAGVSVSINGIDWFDAVFNEDTGEYTFDFGQLGVDNYTLHVRVTLTNGNVIEQTLDFEVNNVIPWANKTETTASDASSDFNPNELPDSDFFGAVAGNAGVNGGQATYSIPIAMPPGRAGMQPSVSLNYSSSGGNGLAGVGWSLSVGGSITRCAQTVAHDGQFRNPSFNLSDSLCFNGQRLILTSGIHGKIGAEYRTEIDQFAVVKIAGGDTNSVASYFEVTYKNGGVARYGSTSNDAEVVLDNHSKTQSWLLNFERDVSGANYIHYEYETKGAAELVIKKILYTGSAEATKGNRTVTFTYTTDRADTRSGYSYGGYWESTALLDTITTSLGSEILYIYDLDYGVSGASGRSLLSSLSQCGQDGMCFEPTNFNWQDAAFTYELGRLNLEGTDVLTDKRELNQAMPYGDINGDGAIDWPGYFIDADGKGEAHEFELNRCYQNSLSLRNHCISADFNNDGLTDGWSTNGAGRLVLERTNLSDITTDVVFNDGPIDTAIKDDHIADIRDYNGDGFVDLVVYHFSHSQPEIQLTLYPHTGELAQPYRLIDATILHRLPVTGIAPNRSASFDVSYMGDLDGNGLPDLIELNYQNSNSPFFAPIPRPVRMLLNEGGVLAEQAFNFDISTDSFDTFFFSQFIDVNGDGLDDWIGYTNQDTPVKQLAINIGGGDFATPVDIDIDFAMRAYHQYDQSSGERIRRRYPKYTGGMKVHDINMDGIPELLVPGEILLEACAKVSEASDSGVSVVTKCGHDLYTAVRMSANSNDTTPLNTAQFDDSVYRYNAYSFSQDDQGNFVTSVAPTELIGNAYQSTLVDAYGEGFVDLVSVIGVRSAIEPCPAQGSDAYLNHNDSMLEVFDQACQYGVWVNRSKGSAESDQAYAATDVLKSVVNGVGVQSRWQYRPLSSSDDADGFDLYDIDERDVNDADHFHFGSSMYVVSDFYQSNGLGSAENTTKFEYRGAMYNNKGRGFRGFRTIIETDVRRKIRTETDFKQKFPFSSLVENQRLYKVGENTPFKTTINSYARNENHDITNVYHIFNESSFTINYDLDAKTEMSSSRVQVDEDKVDAYGNIGIKVTTVTDEYITHTTTETTDFSVATDSWMDKYLSSTVKREVVHSNLNPAKHANTTTTKVVTTHVTDWDSEHRKPKQFIVAKGSEPVDFADCNLGVLNGCTVTDVIYNTYGLATDTDITGLVQRRTAESETIQSEQRTTDTSYTPDGYFPLNVTLNSGTHSLVTSTIIDPLTGLPTSSTDVSGVVTSMEYDGLYRMEKQSVTGFPDSFTRYQTPDNDKPSSDAITMVVQYQNGTPETASYLDKFGRSLRTRTQQFSGENAFTDVRYDNLGRTSRESNVHSGSPLFTVFSDYDELDRLGRKVTPATNVNESLTTDYSYSELTTKVDVMATQGATLKMSRTYNSLGQLVQTEDALKDGTVGGLTKYVYDAAGNPIVIQDAANNSISAQYDDLGRKTWVQDPNQGKTDFTYNDFGELEKETDANGHRIWYELDQLGRVTSRLTDNGKDATFVWDTRKKGLLTSESVLGASNTYDYDESARTVSVVSNIDGSEYEVKTQYDQIFGRPKALVYPHGLTVELLYNDYGYLTHEQNAASGYVYRQVTEQDAWGNITKALMTNGGLQGNYSFSGRTGQMLYNTVDRNGESIHTLDYSDYDSYGNIITQSNGTTGNTASETFKYDVLHRLVESSLTVDGPPGSSVTTNYHYDKVGNLKKKTDYSTNDNNAYQYQSMSNKLESVALKGGGTVTFGYDNKGNQTTRNGVNEVTYNVFNKPLTISKNSQDIELFYGADLMRYKQVREVEGKEITTHYVGKLFEVETKDGISTSTAYISDVAIISDSSIDTTIRFTHRDRLGSATTFTDHNCMETAYRSFDPFGKPKGGNWGILSTPQLSEADSDMATRRGFTDHEHLDEAELIHMNGRVYDYNVGRFMSVDPLIQGVGNSQGINPYSYVMNNPLAFVDPTGYSAADPASTKTTTHKVSAVGSRITRTVTATTDVTTGDTTVSGGSYAARSAVADTIVNAYNATAPTDIGSQQKAASAKSGVSGEAGGVQYSSYGMVFDYETPGIEDVTQSPDLSDSEEAKRLAVLENFVFDVRALPEKMREDEELKARFYLRQILLTDKGGELARLATNRKIRVALIRQGTSNYDNPLETIEFNVGFYGYERAKGSNTFVDKTGLRTFTHEFVHAMLRHHGGTQYNERVASQVTNIIMKQHFLRLKMPNLVGIANRYGPGLQKLPVGATLKEKFTDGHL